MCLLTYLPPGVQPDLEALSNGASWNEDGHGYAIVAGRRLIVRRSMDGEALIQRFAHERARLADGPALFHSRLATHGSLGQDNCHPFAVAGDARTVIAHNGILPEEVQPRPGDVRSDTRICAEDFMPRLGSMRVARHRNRLQQWMGISNKMLILTADPRFRESAYLLNEHLGHWDEGIWYSNRDYLFPFWEEAFVPAITQTVRDDRAAQGGQDARFAGMSRCPFCLADLDPERDDCALCGTCFTCWGATPCRCRTSKPGGSQ